MEARKVMLHLELITDAPLETLGKKEMLNFKYRSGELWIPVMVDQVTAQVVQPTKEEKKKR